MHTGARAPKRDSFAPTLTARGESLMVLALVLVVWMAWALAMLARTDCEKLNSR